jgi:hypothetical protein
MRMTNRSEYDASRVTSSQMTIEQPSYRPGDRNRRRHPAAPPGQ